MKMVLCLIAAIAFLGQAYGQEMIKTGEGIREKNVAFLSFNVYKISHSIATLPEGEDLKTALISSTADKKFELEFLRDVELDKITQTLTDAYGKCDFKDKARTKQLLSAFKNDFKKGDKITISYSAGKTSVSAGENQLSMGGEDIMQATWCIWLGKGIDDQPKLKGELVKMIKR